MSKKIQQYQQLTEGRRYQIQALHRNGFSQRKIATHIGVNDHVVCPDLDHSECPVFDRHFN